MNRSGSRIHRRAAAAYTFGAALEARMERLLAAGGERVRLGRSREGRDLLGYRWNAANAPDADRGVLLLSLLHPMEWIGLEAHLALLERWLLPGAHAGGARGFPLYSIPIANPDGCARVEESLLRGRFRWVRGNAARVDLNRNFPRGWRPRPDWLRWWPLYRQGPAPLSEPETAAIAGWARGLPIRLALSLHSFGRWIFWPPAYTRRTQESAARHEAALAAAGSIARPYRAKQLGRWSPWFRAHGTEIDFLSEETGGLAYLVELSGGSFLRWGWREAHHPFFLFNPPDPDAELSRIVPVLSALISTGSSPLAPR